MTGNFPTNIRSSYKPYFVTNDFDVQSNPVANVFGLLNCQGPLPNYLLEATSYDMAFRDFVQLFDGALYSLWLQSLNISKKVFTEYLMTLTPILNDSEIQFFSYFFANKRTPIRLQYMIRNFLKIDTVFVKSISDSYLSIENSNYLGKNYLLGDDIILGEKILLAKHQYNIIIETSNEELAKNLLSRTKIWRELQKLIELYCGSKLQYNCHIQFQNLIANHSLGTMQLGQNCILASEKTVISTISLQCDIGNDRE